MWRKIPDSFPFGLITGVICLAAGYFLFNSVRLMAVHHYDNPYMYPEPRVQLFAILVNIILFRFMVVRFQKENTGRGILFSTIVISLTYLFFFYRFNFRMS